MMWVLLACAPIVTDGDTLRCGGERIRLAGIDAPEMPGHCRRGRHCAPGDPFASRESLRRMIEGKRISVRRIMIDRYGRTVAAVRVNGMDLSCAQLRAGRAIYVRRWDEVGAVRRSCPAVTGK